MGAAKHDGSSTKASTFIKKAEKNPSMSKDSLTPLSTHNIGAGRTRERTPKLHKNPSMPIHSMKATMINLDAKLGTDGASTVPASNDMSSQLVATAEKPKKSVKSTELDRRAKKANATMISLDQKDFNNITMPLDFEEPGQKSMDVTGVHRQSRRHRTDRKQSQRRIEPVSYAQNEQWAKQLTPPLSISNQEAKVRP